MTTKLINMDRIFLCFRTWAADVREGFVEITRHSLAVIGLGVILVLLAFTARPNLQSSASDFLFGMLCEIISAALAPRFVSKKVPTLLESSDPKKTARSMPAVSFWQKLTRKVMMTASG